MYYLKSKIKDFNGEYITVEINGIGYKGIKMFKEELLIDQEILMYTIKYENDYINEILFFLEIKAREICEIILNIKNIGITTIKKLFTNLNYKEVIKICKEQDINRLMVSTKLSESICKKVIQEVRSKLFKVKYNSKQMNIINTLNKLGYKISDIYKSINKIDFTLSEDLILERAILNLNSYGK
ncbi:hypothetical protein [Spiroplasma monobiae]|uniref:Holliday junction DNA helicase RuvA n=1 Tax=Spiroplasma monobiae MQ-1 TaxID=1336748 RepID=A0A2K9LUA9_SPISQ|nr:hypothetical protein [Spiroplasma monobiae]AUM62643.1 Holliday junction DNA helicase RuvA [Spiroplasma monobiae MQ-1]